MVYELGTLSREVRRTMTLRPVCGSARYAAALSAVLSALLLVAIVVAAAVALWLWAGGLVSAGKPPARLPLLKVEAVSVEGSTVIIYVRNLGDAPTFIDRVYIYAGGKVVGVYNVGGVVLRVWGGDRWDLSTGSPRLVERGLILDEEFSGGLSGLWERRSSNADVCRVWVSGGYLGVEVKSVENREWATCGVFTRRPLQLPQSYVVEVELWKNGRAYWYYAVCAYVMSGNASSNPYYNAPWLALKIYPRRGRSEAQVVYRSQTVQFTSLYTWSGSEQPHAHFLLIVRGGRASRVLLWVDGRSGEPSVNESVSLPAVTGAAYVALTVDNPTIYLDRGSIGYFKLYRSLSFTLEGLKPGKRYTLAGSRGSCTVTPSTPSLTINPLSPPQGCEWLRDQFYQSGYPLDVTVASEELARVEPGSVKTIMVTAPGLEPGRAYIVRVVSRDGVEAEAVISA